MRAKILPPPSPLDRALRKLGEVPGNTHPTTREGRTFVAQVSSLPGLPERHRRNFDLELEEYEILTGHWRAFIDAWPQDPGTAA